MKCKDCEYSHVIVDKDEGFQTTECHRYPPVPWNFKSWRPETRLDGWCGEFNAKVEDRK